MYDIMENETAETAIDGIDMHFTLILLIEVVFAILALILPIGFDRVIPSVSL